MRTVAIALGLVLFSLDLVSDAFVVRPTTCRGHAAVVGASTSPLEAHTGNSCGREGHTAEFVRQRYRGQVCGWFVG